MTICLRLVVHHSFYPTNPGPLAATSFLQIPLGIAPRTPPSPHAHFHPSAPFPSHPPTTSIHTITQKNQPSAVYVLRPTLSWSSARLCSAGLAVSVQLPLNKQLNRCTQSKMASRHVCILPQYPGSRLGKIPIISASLLVPNPRWQTHPRQKTASD